MQVSWVWARTVFALGLGSIFRLVAYRVGVRLGLNPVRRLHANIPTGPFFGPMSAGMLHEHVADALPVAELKLKLFSYVPVSVGRLPPDWLANPLTGQRVPNPDRPWWLIPDFDPDVGDIKLIWELSRMDWVLSLAKSVRQGYPDAIDTLNSWLVDWCHSNPPYSGPNWKCGQEASIRVMHLAMASLVLDQARTLLPRLKDLIVLHLQRIAPTVQYAIAQNNNHGTSEAAALFIGGSWLTQLGDDRGKSWESTGRDLLQNRARRLIGSHGTFSQYSVNYHRMMLDTFSMVECWRRYLDLDSFDAEWLDRARAATLWLYAMTDPETGDAPNAGANDGARLLQLTEATYRDFRPSVSLGMALFTNQCAYEADGPWRDALTWLNVALPERVASPAQSLQADDGGFMVLRRGRCMALLRYPRFRFRPSQADGLHLDLWVNGKCLLRDAGTYSYNTDEKWLAYFGGVAGHNTVQFDGREQMPRLSRFLLGDWLRTEQLDPLTVAVHDVSAGAGYRDRSGARHHRHVSLQDSGLLVTDRVEGFKFSAVLRWRLTPGSWVHLDVGSEQEVGVCKIQNELGHTVTVCADVPFVRCEIVQGWESLHYLEKTSAPVLELEMATSGACRTSYYWGAD